MTKTHPTRWRHLSCWTNLLLICWLLMSLPSCGKRADVPRSPADIRGYLGTPPNLAHVDPSSLQGRRILLDPGHGGFFRGAVGHNGLTEAEINLGVALYLQGMLHWAGAEVHMTRTADVDFLTPADSSLVADLAARVAICDSLCPDVFLSIHHNSTIDRDPTINETQTYYPLGREGADLDLARAIHRRLVQTLDIEPARILPGNFYVLRHVSVPAVLGEPAMLSNPVMEGRLNLARSLELEASAYFLGLCDYFAAGTPRWRTALPKTINLAAACEPLIWTFDAGSPQAPALDPTTISLTIDGRPLPFHLDPAATTVQVLPAELRGSAHLELLARNLAGQATPKQSHILDVRRNGPWRTLCILEAVDQSPRHALFTYLNEGQNLDDCGELLLATETLVTDAMQSAGISDADTIAGLPLPVYPGRRGWLLLDLTDQPDLLDLTDPAADRPEAWRILERLDDSRWSIHAESSPHVQILPSGQRWLMLLCDQAFWPHRNVPGKGWRLRLPAIDGEETAPMLSGHLKPHWPVVPYTLGKPLWLEAEGAAPMLLTADARQDMIPGNEAAAIQDTLVWRPLLPAFIGLRVALDARGGGADEQGRGPQGTRGSDLNLQIIRRLAALLRGAGCEVLLLREDDAWLPDSERIRRADRFGANLYLAVERGSPSVRHHPGSRIGAPWAVQCASSLARPVRGDVPVTAAHDYVLRHTACPAIMVLLEPPATSKLEDRLTSPAWQNAVARALLRGTTALVQPEAESLDIGQLLSALGKGAISEHQLSYAILDGNFQWLPPGRMSAIILESWQDRDPGLPGLGDHHFLELHAGPHWQLWSLTRHTEGAWHGQLRLENR